MDSAYFMKYAVHHLTGKVDPEQSRALLNSVMQTREFSRNLFMNQGDFKRNPQYKGVNPIPGRNLAEALESNIAFIERDAEVIETLTAVLGKEYRIKDRKFVCGVPVDWMPEWVSNCIAENGVKNLGAYILPEYRDITYFSGIDFHQDIIDWPGMGPRFITMYVYLDDVGLKDAPLHVLPGSHLLGATSFPHKLTPIGDNRWEYGSDGFTSIVTEHQLLTGPAGSISLWHPFILHGTQPDKGASPRISLRYLVQMGREDDGKGNDCLLEQLNKTIKGPLMLESTRYDLDEKGDAVLKGNIVNKIEY